MALDINSNTSLRWGLDKYSATIHTDLKKLLIIIIITIIIINIIIKTKIIS